MGQVARTRLYPALILSLLVTLVACGSDEPLGTTVPGIELSASGELLVVGDWGSGTEDQDAVAEAMEGYSTGRDIAAILTTGDNFYTDDAEELMHPYSWASDRNIPFIVSWGNHDIEDPERIALVEETFAGAPRWAVHEWGDVDIVILDSTQIESRSQTDFLTRALAESDAPTIVVFHHPPYSCGTHGDTPEVREQWVSRFDDDVFLVLNGHEHNYQRFQDEGVTYVVTGGGGRFLTGMAECSSGHLQRIAGEETHHFVGMRLSDALHLTVIDTEGDVVDEVSLALP